MHHDVTFLHSDHFPRCTASVDKRFGYHTIQFMSRGAVELFYDDRRHEMRGGWLWPCHPGPWVRFHAWPRDGWWDHRYVAMTGPTVLQWDSAGLWPREPEALGRGEVRAAASAMDEVIELTRRPGRWAHLRAVNVVERLLLDRAERREPGPPSRPDWLGPVLARLSDVTVDEPDYQALAEAHGMSLTTLRRQFRQCTGTSPHHHHLACRVAEARRLLGETDLPIKAVADRLGYRDVYYFSRQFRQRVGVAPSAYRRSRQG